MIYNIMVSMVLALPRPSFAGLPRVRVEAADGRTEGRRYTPVLVLSPCAGRIVGKETHTTILQHIILEYLSII
jgi:hypothetical protein